MRLPVRLPSKLPSLSLTVPLGRRSGADVVGLDIQPGFVAAVKVKVNGSIVAEQAVSLPLPADAMRDGEVLDITAVADTLRELFAGSGLGKRVRIGVANQRTVLRTLELPPVTDDKDLAAAVTFQAQDQVPMPLNNAVLDFHPLGIVDTPAGPRQRVVLVAAQRDMIERLLAAVRQAGLQAEGVDLSAFALIRALYRHAEGDDGRVLYLNVDGLTNLAIAEGTVCRFTRVLGSGLEGMASELAERRGIALDEARALIAAIDLNGPTVPEPAPVVPEPEPASPEPESVATEPSHDELEPAGSQLEPDSENEPEPEAEAENLAAAPASPAADPELPLPLPLPEPLADEPAEEIEAEAQPIEPAPVEHEVPLADRIAETIEPAAEAPEPEATVEPAVPPIPDAADESDMSYEELAAVPFAPEPEEPVQSDEDIRAVLENGIREISGEVRNSLDFHRSQDGGGDVSHIVLSGSAQDIPGFSEALQLSLGVEVRSAELPAGERLGKKVSAHRLAVAAGLAATEAPQ